MIQEDVHFEKYYEDCKSSFSFGVVCDQIMVFINQKKGQLLFHNQNQIQFLYYGSIRENQLNQIRIHGKDKNLKNVLLNLSCSWDKNEANIDRLLEKINQFNTEEALMNSRVYFNENSREIVLHSSMQYQTLQRQSNRLLFYEDVETKLQKFEKILINCFKRLDLKTKLDAKIANSKEKTKKYIKSLKKIICTEIRDRQKSTLPVQFGFEISENINSTVTEINLESNKELSSISVFEHISKKQQKLQEGDQSTKRILSKIQIHNKTHDRGWKAPDSGYGKITKYKIIFSVDFQSIENETNMLIQNTLNIPEKKESVKISREVVQKTVKNPRDDGCMESFNNEAAILKYLRNGYDRRIASYYIDSKQEKIKKIYSDYYSFIAADYKFKESDAFEFIINLAKGIDFLQKNQVLHRDLKPQNLMIDQSRMTRIIDFGSGIIKAKSKYCQQISPKLKTTVHYNISYPQVNASSISQQQFEKHDYFDMYAFGKIIKQIDALKSNKLGISLDLDWMFLRATDLNPYNRLTAHHAGLYAQYLRKLWKCIKFTSK